ncbi:Uncharacterised protein [Vibrio cholerae]|nr:Uncharacterised protein [Vibrio cholerae]
MVDILKIDQYRDLCPTPAHYYIALRQLLQFMMLTQLFTSSKSSIPTPCTTRSLPWTAIS